MIPPVPQARIHLIGVGGTAMGALAGLLKCGLGSTYVSVEPYDLFRYLDEQTFRYNRRFGTDSERFACVRSSVAGRRLMYKQLIGAGGES